MDVDTVTTAMAHAHAEAVAPYFRRLGEGDVDEKAPGEVVTVADEACERLLGPLLRDVVDAPVVGEEAVSADPDLLRHLADAPAAWLVDPIDGTRNFAAGKREYAVMVAFVEQGQTTAAWILQPWYDTAAVAVRGAGATLNGQPLTMPPPGQDREGWQGVIKDRFLPPERRPDVDRVADGLGERAMSGECAGFEYPGVARGDHTCLLYWRTKPWDHAPGALLATEAGGLALRPDGRPYVPVGDESGLVVAHRTIAADLVADFFGPTPV